MTYSQIANSLNMSVNTVKSFCQRNSISTSNKMRYAGNKEKCKHCGKQLIQSAKGAYTVIKNEIVRVLLSANITITDRRYIGYEDDTGYHHYAIDVVNNYELED